MKPDQADFLIRGVYVPGLQNEHRITRSIIGAIPLDKGDYRPDEVSKSAMELAWHIVAAETRFMDALPAGEFDFSPRHRPDSVKNSADLAAWYTDNFEQRLEKVEKGQPLDWAMARIAEKLKATRDATFTETWKGNDRDGKAVEKTVNHCTTIASLGGAIIHREESIDLGWLHGSSKSFRRQRFQNLLCGRLLSIK